MAPPRDLPLDPSWSSEDEYVESILSFANHSDIFHNLCGGIHVLDFLTREPDLYTTVLPQEWREWFETVSIDDVLELLLRTPLNDASSCEEDSIKASSSLAECQPPPQSLLDYIRTIRRHCLNREVRSEPQTMPRHIAVGMKPKKIHEVSNFAAYVDKLSADLASSSEKRPAIVDFGSGQNYLGRTLVSQPYENHVIAIERRHHNIDGARVMDVHAKLTEKDKIMRNKKEYKKLLALRSEGVKEDMAPKSTCEDVVVSPQPEILITSPTMVTVHSGRGSLTYVEHDIEDGDLESILYQSSDLSSMDSSASSSSELGEATYCHTTSANDSTSRPDVMVVSLHSCGNLVHHGLRSLVLNPSVSAVAMIGCCYNLMTERLGPATYKLPTLRPNHPRLEATSSAYDPHGFPMSKTLENFDHKHGRGVRLNITARMMAVQAPQNWGPIDSEAFFRRHFYRALLQRVLLDRGVVKQCSDPDSIIGGSISGKDESGTPLIVGSLRKSCFVSFRVYVRGALEKLVQDPVDGEMIGWKTSDITDDIIDQYERDWGYAKKHLSIIWSLMAFSAGVVESIIAVDRWLFLREQDCVEKCWVEPVFDYKLSPRNLVVVGIKKQRRHSTAAPPEQPEENND